MPDAWFPRNTHCIAYLEHVEAEQAAGCVSGAECPDHVARMKLDFVELSQCNQTDTARKFAGASHHCDDLVPVGGDRVAKGKWLRWGC